MSPRKAAAAVAAPATRTRTCRCGNLFEVAATGRPREYCSRRCSRQAEAEKKRLDATAPGGAEVVDFARRVRKLPAQDQALVTALVDWLETRG